ncbi:MAG: metallophosphoesterase family protein [Chloroflexota bacterium]
MPSSMLVVWQTDLPIQGEVAYGPPGAVDLLQAESSESTDHTVLLPDLSPSTLYRYQVVSQGWPMSSEATFRTAPAPYASPFSFVVVGDTRSGHETHAAMIEAILPLAPDFVLHVGDLVSHGSRPEYWTTFFDIEQPLLATAPIYPTLGNHEEVSPLYFDYFFLPGNERWYTFVYGNARFISLEVDGAADYGPGSEQYAFLETALATSDQTWQIVYFHFPPYSGTGEEPGEVDVRRALTPLFVSRGVDLVFSGHHHNYQRYLVDGISYVVTGGGGAELYPITQPDEDLVTWAEEHHFVSVTISGATLSATVLTPWGEMLDQFTLRPR